jgi:signal transduction histidine kinase/anti-sigma regulatory factor (Ser/Thr protein kinase)
MVAKAQLQFEASAYLQTLIGRELIRGEDLAVIELIKNAYDSGARNVIITVRSPSLKEPGEIEVRDDGAGMGLAQFRRAFMFAGFSAKEKPSNEDRIPTGEKGIGRFAADRLGQKLTVQTKLAGAKKGIRVEIDWALFKNRTKRFSDVSVPFFEVPIPIPAEESGTILTITRLREKWTREQIIALRTTLAQLLNPYHRPDDFAIDLQVPSAHALSGPIVQHPISTADIEIEFRVHEGGIVTRERRGRLYAGKKEAEELRSAVDLTGLAGLRGRFFYFLRRPSKEESRGLVPGVRLFRDGFRVEPLGSNTADWLGIAEKRVKRAGHAHVVPNRLFGFVTISRLTNPELKDTTSREALIDTSQARGLVSVLRQQIDFLEKSIETDVAEPRWKESRERKAVALDQARLQSLSIMSFGLGHELRQPLQSIRFEAANIKTRLQQLNIDDFEIAEAQQNIDEDIERIDRNIKMIASISSGSLEKNEEIDIARVVRDQASLFETRCAALGIELTVQGCEAARARANATLIGVVLINLIKNAIDALSEVEDGRQRKLIVSVSDQNERYLITVADNATGIPDDIKPKIFKKFATQKTGGWGVGLYNCRLFLKNHGGDISFESTVGVGTVFTFTIPKMGN